MRLPLVVWSAVIGQAASGALQWRCNRTATTMAREGGQDLRGRGRSCERDIRMPRVSSNGTALRLATRCSARASRPGLRSPADAIVHSRAWKAQVPYLARTFRVVTIDPRGNGRSGRPQSADAYADTEFVADTIAVMDAVGIDQAVLIGLCEQCLAGLAHGGPASRPGARRGEHRHLRPRSSRRRRPGADVTTSTRSSAPTRAGRKRTGTTGCVTGGDSPSSSSASCCPSRTPPSSTRTAWAGPWRPAPETNCWYTDDGPLSSSEPRGDRGRPGAGCAVPCWPSMAGGPLPAVEPQ